jgi:hypothetical protein
MSKSRAATYSPCPRMQPLERLVAGMFADSASRYRHVLAQMMS